MLKDSRSGYGLITITLHWVCAALVIFSFALGVYMRSLEYYSPWYHKGPELHISLGLLLLFLMSLRIFWRAGNPTPTPLPTINAPTQRAATLVKIALYVFVFSICITGYLMTTAEGQGAHFFDFFSVPVTLELSATNVDRVGLLHKYFSWAVIGIALLHGGAALFHHFVKKDRTLLRMLKPANLNPANLNPTKKAN